MSFLQTNQGSELSDDKGRLDRAMLYDFLANQSHWARGIPEEVLEKAIAHSLCFGLYRGKVQAGFARVVTDQATFAYLCDVFILPKHRGKGLSSWMVEQVMTHPELQGLRKYALVTTHARRVYQRAGFRHLEFPERWLEIHHPDLYTKGPQPVLLDTVN